MDAPLLIGRTANKKTMSIIGIIDKKLVNKDFNNLINIRVYFTNTYLKDKPYLKNKSNSLGMGALNIITFPVYGSLISSSYA